MKLISKISLVVLLLGGFIFEGSCYREKKNPVKYTGKLMKRGHIDLYNNGALRIPGTVVKIIPPGETPIEIAKEFIGIKARDSFLLALKNAADSVYMISDGAKLSLRLAKKVTSEGNKIADILRKDSNRKGRLIISRTYAKGIGIVGDSWKFSSELVREMKIIGDSVRIASQEVGEAIDENITSEGVRLVKTSAVKSAMIFRKSINRTGTSLNESWNQFIVGYTALPKEAVKDLVRIKKALSGANPAKIAIDENEWRKKYSGYFAKLVVNTGKTYTSNIKESFSNAKRDLKNYRTTGISLATLKALRWVLKGILYDAVIKPVVKLGIGALGYIGVNGVAYPVMVISKEAANITYVALQLTWFAAANTYRLVAPSAILAATGIYGFFDVTISSAATTAGTVGGTTVGALLTTTGKMTSSVVRTAGYVAGKTVQYVGVPLVAAGIAVTGTTVGSVVSVSGAVPGGAFIVQGEVTSAAVRAASYTGAGVILGATTAVSVAASMGKGVYYVVKAGIVPSAYTMGTGVVLGYGALTHLAAQTILGVSDFAYLVLSLEGPRWVIYAIRGKKGNGKDLPVGTALDLNKMRMAGEEIYAVPVSQQEMLKVVKSMTGDLPVDIRKAPKSKESDKKTPKK
ncbi:MAG: hypothetical protein JXR95_10095 [Deltaproteobacteria bacterium]|nr:hypothetical protein [Deltaproteobacteria bacterium]